MKRNKSLIQATCTTALLMSLIIQACFWLDVLFYKTITELDIKLLYFSAGFLAVTFIVLILHNIARLCVYIVNSHDEKRRRLNRYA